MAKTKAKAKTSTKKAVAAAEVAALSQVLAKEKLKATLKRSKIVLTADMKKQLRAKVTPGKRDPVQQTLLVTMNSKTAKRTEKPERLPGTSPDYKKKKADSTSSQQSDEMSIEFDDKKEKGVEGPHDDSSDDLAFERPFSPRYCGSPTSKERR